MEQRLFSVDLADDFSSELDQRHPQGPRIGVDDSDELQMALELLAACNGTRLRQFLGSLIGDIAKKRRRPLSRPVSYGLSKALHVIAMKTLCPLGLNAKPEIADSSLPAGTVFGLELEGLSPEDQELEVAKQFVRLTANAVANAAEQSEYIGTGDVTRAALQKAAALHAPGLFPSRRTDTLQVQRWVREGDRIVVYGV